MHDEAAILKLAADCAAAGEPFVLATVIATKGSSPRNAGAKLLWRPVQGLSGTVGGGQFESLVIEAARGHFQGRSTGTQHFVLGAEADQCCGGTMDVFFEYVGPRQRLVVFGAGHVSEALVRVLRGQSLEVVIADDRPDWNNAERFGRCRRVMDFDEGVEMALAEPDRTLVAVMTYSHDIDFDIVCDLLAKGAGGTGPRFLGLIGSRTKFACFRTRFAQRGLTEEQIDRIHCPIGIGDLGKAPEQVAISIAAQVLGVCREMEQEDAAASTPPTGERVRAEA
jgi:xanthine dehydrogenase accessory factor